MIFSILFKSSWQFYKRHPAQLALSILGIVLGVAIVTAVLITNNSSQRAFALSSEALYGRTTHYLSGANGIEQSDYVALRKRYAHWPMAPVVTGYVALDEQVFSILGIDPFAEAGLSRMQNLLRDPEQGQTSIGMDSLINPNALLISKVSAERQSLQIPTMIQIEARGKKHTALLVSTFTSDIPAASTGLMIGDIAFVQHLLEKGSRIDRIDLILNEGQAQALHDDIGKQMRLVPAEARTQTMQAMTRGFQINLTAMSLLALVVGAFLIHNTMTFAVVQRRELFAVKRITGITSGTMFLSILAEAIAISTAASVIGIALGYVLSGALIQLTTRTINDLYFVLHVQETWFSPWVMVLGMLLGIGSSVLAASLSALDAASTSPVQARQRSMLEARTLMVLPWMASAGLFTSLLGIVLAILPLQSLLIGFMALMLIILGYGLMIPWLVHRLSHMAKPALDNLGIATSLALGGIHRNISRTGLAIAALTIAVSATFGVDIMIGSFRSTVDQWLRNTLQSDLYISAPSLTSTEPSGVLASEMIALLANAPGVQSISTGRTINTATSVGYMDMLIVQTHAGGGAGFELIESSGDKPWLNWKSEGSVMISEPLATKHDLTVGSQLSIFTEQSGNRPFTVEAIFRDYGSSHGKVLMARETFDQYWNDPAVGTLGIVLEPGNDPGYMTDRLTETLATSEQPLLIQTNALIHEQSLAVFDRTFEVTRVLRWLTVGVAFVGIFSALLALHLERAREFAILRASGATRQTIMMIVVLQTLLMGLVAGLMALPLGWLMSEVLIKVINVRSFGWSMNSLLPAGSIVESLLLACTSALLAGLYPAYRLSRLQIASQLRDH